MKGSVHVLVRHSLVFEEIRKSVQDCYCNLIGFRPIGNVVGATRVGETKSVLGGWVCVRSEIAKICMDAS